MTEETSIEIVKPTPEQVEATLRKHIYTAIGTGLVPIPVVDFVGFFAIQLNLIRALSKQYNVPFKKERAKAIVGTLVGGGVGVVGSALVASLSKFIPFVGFTAGALAGSIGGGAVTYALGRLIIRHYDKGGSLDDFNAEEAKKAFSKTVEEGKEVVSKIAAQTKEKAKAVKEAVL